MRMEGQNTHHAHAPVPSARFAPSTRPKAAIDVAGPSETIAIRRGVRALRGQRAARCGGVVRLLPIFGLLAFAGCEGAAQRERVVVTRTEQRLVRIEQLGTDTYQRESSGIERLARPAKALVDREQEGVELTRHRADWLAGEARSDVSRFEQRLPIYGSFLSREVVGQPNKVPDVAVELFP